MTTMALSATPSSSTPPSATRTTTTALAAIVLIAFVGFSLWVVGNHGLLGFLTLAGREPWALQLLLDLAIACSFGVNWMVRDARGRGLAAWPFVVAVVLVGSMGLLGYVIVRGLRPSKP